jgi:hypothetical protein
VTPEIHRDLSCDAAEQLVTLYVCDELSEGERASVESHIAACSNCAAALATELRLRQTLSVLRQPADVLDAAGALLAQCRSELAEVLDDAEDAHREFHKPTGVAAWFSKMRIELAMHPALAATVFVLIGLGLGRLVPTAQNVGAMNSGIAPAMTVSAPQRISDQDLQNMNVSTVNLVPSNDAGSPQVIVQLRSVKPLEIQGSAGDAQITQILSNVILNGQRYDSGVRLDSVEALGARTEDSAVRRVLCTAALHDANPGVRLRALEALSGASQDPNVRSALIEVLTHDNNPGVRIEAINSMRSLVDAGGAAGDDRVRTLLEKLSERDANNYVRLQAAAAVRRIDSGNQP